jgi:hypothetical protein
VDFVAYSPYVANAIDSVTYTVTDQSTWEKVEAVDFIYAKTNRGYDRNNSGAVDLSFSHILSKIVLNVTSSDNTDLSNLAVTITGTPGYVTADLADGSITPGSDAIIVPYFKQETTTSGTVTAIVVPHNKKFGRTITFTHNGSNVSKFSFPDDFVFESGKRYEYAFDVKSKVKYAAASNCYIVAPGAEIYIPVSRANEHNPSAISNNDVFDVEIVWADTQDLFQVLASHGAGASGAIKIKIADNKSGNAVVAVKVGGVIKWSWHIWVTDYDPHVNLWDPRTAGGTTTQNIRFMDRNLGAVNDCLGVYYQWGRKDPFQPHKNWNFIDKNTLTTVENGIQNPNTFYIKAHMHWLTPEETNNDLWGGITNTKTIYDPCPAGFKVPHGGIGTASPWSGFPVTTIGETGVTWGTSFWPYGGYRLSNGNFSLELINLLEYGINAAYWTATPEPSHPGNYFVFYYFQLNKFFSVDDFDSGCNAFLIRCVVE